MPPRNSIIRETGFAGAGLVPEKLCEGKHHGSQHDADPVPAQGRGASCGWPSLKETQLRAAVSQLRQEFQEQTAACEASVQVVLLTTTNKVLLKSNVFLAYSLNYCHVRCQKFHIKQV